MNTILSLIAIHLASAALLSDPATTCSIAEPHAAASTPSGVAISSETQTETPSGVAISSEAQTETPSTAALSIADFKQKCKLALPGGGRLSITASCIIEGTVISDYRSPNMDLNPNITHDRVDTDVNDATFYLQQNDACAGIRCRFACAGENQLERGDRVRIELRGCTADVHTRTGAITISGLTHINILSAVHSDPGTIPVKEKFISELTDEDLYTWVSLKETEFIFKNGGYSDIYEAYTLEVPELHQDYYSPSGRMDGWASLLRDSRGANIYLLINGLCPWRRKAVPRGAGSIRGILVNSVLPRYGGYMGRYCIRPVSEADIAIAPSARSGWKTLTGWVLDGSNGANLFFEEGGEAGDLNKEGRKDDKVLSDTGAKALLWTDSGSYIHVDNDLNAKDASTKGFVKDGAILFRGPSARWFSFGEEDKVSGKKSFFISFSPKKAKGTMMALSFSWSAGSQKIDEDWGFPANWEVLCSIDGGKWVRLTEVATGKKSIPLRPQPYWDGKSKLMNNGHQYRTGYDCGLGNQHRSFALPDEVFGADQVVLRLTPVNNNMYSIRKQPSTPGDNRVKITEAFGGRSVIRFGEIRIDYR